MVAALRHAVHAREVADRREIAGFLLRDPIYAAYALGDLDGVGRTKSRFAMAYDDEGVPVALGVHTDGLVPQPIFLMGDGEGCGAILADVLKPREVYFAALPDHQATLAVLYDLDRPQSLLRMAVDADGFSPFPGAAERLLPSDVDALNRLYQLGFGAGFPPAVLREGVYYGIRAGGRLVAAAGTHVVSPAYGIAVVGNVMTHADYRGRGYAKIVTCAVTRDLLDVVPRVALNVYAENTPAVAAYSRLGYREHCRLVERLGRRRSGGSWIPRPIRDVIRLTWPRD